MGSVLLTPEEQVRCWETGDLFFRRRRTQLMLKLAWEQSKLISKKFYVESTRRLGKSTELLQIMTEECIKNPMKRCAYFAPVKDALLDYVKPIIDNTYADCPDEYKPNFNAQRFLLEFQNGSSIIFRGSNNKQHRARRGQEFHLAAIDEARDVNDLAELIDSVVFPALFDSDGFLIISSTPADTRSHPLYAYRQRAIVDGSFFSIKMSEASVIDPDVYTPEKIAIWKEETLKMIDGDDRWKREYECEWVVNKSRAAVPEWLGAYVRPVKKDPYYEFYDRYIAIDWGYRDYTAVGFASYLFRDAVLQVESELMFSGTDVRADLIAAAINRHAVKLWGQDWTATQVSDSADPILINEINAHPKMSFVPVHKAQTLEAMLNQFRGLVNQGKILVSPTCPMTIHCLANAVWDDKRQKLDQDVFARHFDHLMQLVYMTRNVDFNHNPIPSDYMIDGIRVVDLSFNKPNMKSGSANALEEAIKYAQRR